MKAKRSSFQDLKARRDLKRAAGVGLALFATSLLILIYVRTL